MGMNESGICMHKIVVALYKSASQASSFPLRSNEDEVRAARPRLAKRKAIQASSFPLPLKRG